MESSDKKNKCEKIMGYPIQRWVSRVDNELNKCPRGVTIADSMDRDKWRKVIEAAKSFKDRKSSRRSRYIWNNLMYLIDKITRVFKTHQ